MKSLYRRYRPLKLDDVVGQPQVTTPLMKSLESGKMGHAFLFVGPRGCGKTSVARILAHEVNNFKYEAEDDYVDIVEIDGASNRGIDNVRELREKVAIAPTSGKYKIYIIDEVHMLTKEAFNALLKTLEEPPAHAIFIMATTDAHKVPVTISSRAQTYTFKLADLNTMLEYMKSVCDKEGINISEDALKIVVKRGGGSFRDTLSLLDQISSLSDAEITKEMVVSAMGLPEDEKIHELMSAYVSGDINSISANLKELFSIGVKPETITEELMTSIIDAPTAETLPLLSKLSDVRAPFVEAKLLVALTSACIGEPIKTLSAPTVLRKPAAKTIETKNPTPAQNSTFRIEDYLMKVQELNDAVYSQLKKCELRYSNNTLDIYPLKKIVRSILSRDNNYNILREAGEGVKITIHDAESYPNDSAKDKTLKNISDIMGGEVYNDGGKNPFE